MKHTVHLRRVHVVLTIGAPGVPQLVGATCGIQFAPPVSFFSLCGSLKEVKCRIEVKLCANNLSLSLFGLNGIISDYEGGGWKSNFYTHFFFTPRSEQEKEGRMS